jgi:hypothetical protein
MIINALGEVAEGDHDTTLSFLSSFLSMARSKPPFYGFRQRLIFTTTTIVAMESAKKR